MEAKPTISFSNFLKPTWRGSLYYLFTFIAGGAYMPFIYVYLTQLGLSGEQVGLLATMAPVMTMLLATAISSVADRLHRRRLFLQIALGFVGFLYFTLGIPSRFIEIAILMFLIALFNSPVMSIADSLIARMAQREKINYGGMRLWGSLGFAISSLAFGALWQAFGFKPMFLTACLLYIPIILVAGTLEEPRPVTKENRVPILRLLKDKGLLLLLIATFLASISNSISMTFSGIYMSYLGGGNLLVGMLTGVSALAEPPAMFLSERVANRIKRINTVIFSFFLMAGAFTGYMLTRNPNLLPILSLVKGLGYGLWIPVTVRLVTDRTPEEWAATSQSLLAVCMFGLAPLVAGPVGGWLHDVINPGAVFGLGVGTLIIAALVLWIGNKKEQLD